MKWNHLPVAGGLYNQHPLFVDDMMVLMDADNRAEEKRQKKQEAQQRRQSRR